MIDGDFDRSDYVPACNVIGNVQLVPVPEDQIPVDAIVLLKTIGSEGEASWYTRYTYDLHAVETLGAINAARLLVERDVLNTYIPYVEEDGE